MMLSACVLALCRVCCGPPACVSCQHGTFWGASAASGAWRVVLWWQGSGAVRVFKILLSAKTQNRKNFLEAVSLLDEVYHFRFVLHFRPMEADKTIHQI